LRIHAFDLGRETTFDHAADLLDFFDEHLKDVPTRGDGAPVHYFTLGEEKWKSARGWPPPAEPRALYLAADRRLADRPGVGFDAVEGDAGSGERSRWRSLISLVPGDYPDRRARDARLLFYESLPLERDTEVTGHPKAHLSLSWAGDDGQVFVYLEDVRPDGAVCYVTEGQRRAVHGGSTFTRAEGRRLSSGEIGAIDVDLLPASSLFLRGHRIRVVLAPCDLDPFARPGSTALRVHRATSRVVLPVVAR